MEAALSLSIVEVSAPFLSLQIGCRISAYLRLVVAIHSQDHSHPCSQLGRWLADWPVSGIPSLFVETKSVHSLGSNADSIVSILLGNNIGGCI